MKISEDGTMEPWATGMRSPAGYGLIGDELFYTDNQGDWVGTGALWHLPKGAFTGHPAGLKWAGIASSTLVSFIGETRCRVQATVFRTPGK